MGMLEKGKEKAKDKKHEKKKHPASKAEEPVAQDAQEPEGADDSAEAEGPEASDAQAEGGPPSPSEGDEQDAEQPSAQGDPGAAPDAQSQGEDETAQGAPPSAGDDQGAPDAQGAPPDADAAPQGDQDNPSTGGSPATSFAGQDLAKVPVPPALKEEYERANAALYTALYKNDQVAQSVLHGIVPDGPHKIESVARMATLLVVQINKQLHFMKDAPQIVMAFTKDAVMHVMDLAEQVKKIQFSDQEATAACGAALEIILRVGGVTKQQMAAMRQHVPRSQQQASMQQYHKTLAYTKGARPQDPNTMNGTPPASGSSKGMAPQQGAPPAQGGASPAGSPQPGAPVTAAPGPGQSAPPGGMLSAAQAPQ